MSKKVVLLQQGLRIGITGYKLLRARVHILSLSPPPEQPYLNLIRTCHRSYPDLIPTLFGHVVDLIRTLSHPYSDMSLILSGSYPYSYLLAGEGVGERKVDFS